jgi:hypothetical protein
MKSSNFNETFEEIGGPEYILKNGSIYIPYLVFYIIGMIVGTIG